MPARTEVLGNGATGGEELLSVAWGFKLLHASLALMRRLMGVLGAIVEISMLPMFYILEDFSLGGSVAHEFIGDDYTRDVG